MGKKLSDRIQQQHFEDEVQEAVLNLLVASAYLRERVEGVCVMQGITPAQYNVLRILRGKYPEGYPRCDIIQRLIDRAPDVTRLIDRLESQGLVERYPSPGDRRLSLARITESGLELLDAISPLMGVLFSEVKTRMSDQEFRQLSELCEKLYEE